MGLADLVYICTIIFWIFIKSVLFTLCAETKFVEDIIYLW